jgi:hypothetical protein
VVNDVTEMPTASQVTTVNHRRRRLLLRTVVVVAAVVFVVANRSELPVAWRSLRRASIG